MAGDKISIKVCVLEPQHITVRVRPCTSTVSPQLISSQFHFFEESLDAADGIRTNFRLAGEKVFIEDRLMVYLDSHAVSESDWTAGPLRQSVDLAFTPIPGERIYFTYLEEVDYVIADQVNWLQNSPDAADGARTNFRLPDGKIFIEGRVMVFWRNVPIDHSDYTPAADRQSVTLDFIPDSGPISFTFIEDVS